MSIWKLNWKNRYCFIRIENAVELPLQFLHLLNYESALLNTYSKCAVRYGVYLTEIIKSQHSQFALFQGLFSTETKGLNY